MKKFVSLTYFGNVLVGVDSDGDIYQLSFDHVDMLRGMTIQLIAINPLRTA